MGKILLLGLFLLSALLPEALAQSRTITGKVTDATNNGALPGVTILVKGTQIGTTTNPDGDYSINVPAANNTLVFSFVGYQTTERTLGTATTLNVALATDAKQLGEVVVTALGVERQERALGYSATTVAPEEITRARASSPMNALQGKVAGANITTASGAPGASTKVILRGYGSIGGNNNPLYVVDGVPINNNAGNFTPDPASSTPINRTQDFGNRANDINPDDIESITILKGAAATSLYGSRAASGVVLITTKKGQAGERIRVDLNSSATFSRPLFLPQLQNTFGQGWSGHFAFEENGSWGPRMDGKERLWGNIVDNSQQLKPFSPQEDNLKDFFETGSSYLNTVGISGGTEKSTFYLSYGNATEDGIVPTDADSYKRNTISLRGSTKGNKLNASSTLNYVRKDAKAVTTGQGGDGTTLFQEIIQTPRDMSIVDFRDLNYKFNTNDNFYNLYAQNPYWPLKRNGNDYEENRLFGNVNLGYDLLSWLSATARLGGDLSNGLLTDWIAPYSLTPGSPNETANPSLGRVNERTRFARELNGDLMLLTKNDLSTDIHLNGIVGYNVNERYSKSGYTYITNLSIPGFYNLSNSSDPVTASTATSLRRLYGVYGSAEFSFRDYLFLTLNARNDWSSTLPADNNSFFYPGVNASFVFTDVFPNLQSQLSYGKIRASWGQTGNDADPYDIRAVLIPGLVQLGFGDIDFPVSGINAYEVSNQIGNLSLQPEITTEYEVGANLNFFNNRIGVDIAYYHRVSSDQILPVPIAVSSGYTTQVLNFGEVRNQGLELLFTATPVKTQNFNWDLRYTFSNNRNEVLKLREGLDEVLLADSYDIDLVAIPGHPLGTFKGPDYVRDPQGRVVVSEVSGYPIVSAEKVIYGSAQPKYIMGFYNTLGYKGLSLNFGFDIRQGGLFYSYTQRLSQFVGNTTNSLYNDRQPFIVPNSVIQNADGSYSENTTPVDMTHIAEYWNDTNNPPIEREHVRDRSFVKLREVALGYSLPKAWISGLRLSDASISVVGRNLLLRTPDNNNIIDPEVTTFGNDLAGELGEFAAGPTTRTLGVSLKLGF
jgi:TonB-linked SusC/RagA family outer membrane protein